MKTETINWHSIIFPTDVRDAVETLIASYQEQLDTRLTGIILYGSGARGHFRLGKSDVNLLVVLDAVDTEALNAMLDATLTARRYNISPLLMTPADLQSFTHVFPIKFLSLKESYQVLWGKDAIKSLEVDPANLRLRCQQEMQNLLMRLRRHYLSRQGHGLTAMVRENLNGFMEALRRVQQLAEGEVPSRKELVARSAKTIGFDQEKLEDLMDIKRPSGHQSLEISHERYNDFMQIIEHTTRFTESLKAK